MSTFSVEACKTLNSLFDQLDAAGFDGECDGYSLAFELPDGRPYLLNYHGVTEQIWLASPLTGAHHFRLQEGRWVSTRGSDELFTLLSNELTVPLT